MALTAAQLTTYFTTANQGVGPSAVQQGQINAIAGQNLADNAAQVQVGALLQGTVGVAALSYAYFGNTTPSAAGMVFLINSPTNANDLNDPYYAQFNQENRFLNFALNLTRTGGDYAAAFNAKFGILDYAGTISLAYEEIIGSANSANPTAAKAFFLNSLPFYQQVVTERGGLASSNPAFANAVKAAIVGSIINEAIKANLGIYPAAYNRMIALLETGNFSGLGGPLLANYPEVSAFTDLTSASQSVSGAGSAVHIRDLAFAALTGTFTAAGGDDQFTIDRGTALTNLSGATFTGAFTALNIRGGGTVTLFDTQLANFQAIGGASSAVPSALIVRNNQGGNVSTPVLTNIAQLNLDDLAPNVTINVTSNSNIEINLGDSNLSGNGTGNFVINASGGNTISLNNGGDDTVNIGIGAGTLNIRVGSGNDNVFFESRSAILGSDTVNGGTGNDTLTFGAGGQPSAGDFANVTGFETINDPNGLVTSVDGLIAAGASLTYRTGTSVAVLNFAAETDGSLNVLFGAGGGSVRGTSNTLTDSYTAPAGHQAITINVSALTPGNTVAQITNVDRIVGFNGAIDKIDLPRQVQNGVIAAGGVAVDVSSAANFIASANNYLAFAGKTMALGDVLIFQNSNGVGGSYFLVQNQSGSNVDAGDLVIQLTGSVTDPLALPLGAFI